MCVYIYVYVCVCLYICMCVYIYSRKTYDITISIHSIMATLGWLKF